MTATHWRKLVYVGLFPAAAVGGVLLWRAAGPWPATIIIALLTLLPGRIQGLVYRDFFRGRGLMAEGRCEEAIPHLERFLHAVRERPWIKRLLWLQFAVYTTDIEAMTLNNLGAAHVDLGNWDAGERYLHKALRLDPRYAVAVYNLSLLAAMRGERMEAERLLGESERLGYSRGGIDALMQYASERLAHVEGRGAG